MTRGARSTWWGRVAALLSGLAIQAACGQPEASNALLASVPRLVADEQTLWLARVEDDRSLICWRGVTGPFERTDALHGAITHLAAADRVLYAMVRDGEFYSAANGQWARRLDLPRRLEPLDWVGDGRGVVALVPSPRRGELPRLVGGVRPPTSQPFDPADSPLSVVRWDSQGWVAMASCPDFLTADGPFPLRIGYVHDELCLAWATADGRHIELLALEPQTGRWQPRGSTPPLHDLNRFWITTVSRVPTLIVATRNAASGEEIEALRRLGSPGAHDAEWRPATLQLSQLPPGIHPRRYEAAFGFNQHVVLLMTDSSGAAFVRFGRMDDSPAETTVAAADVFASGHPPGAGLRWIQASTLLVLFVVLLSLFVFRRGAMVTPAVLPADVTLALAIQRMVGWAVDIVPFALVFAMLLGVEWQRAGQELFNWAAGGDMATGRFPGTRTLVWWAGSCGTYTLYALVLELLTRRTVGKVLTGTRVTSESGATPSAAAIIARNLFRFIEMMPPLWVLGFLVVLSRNRQRLGDIFARTVVVRPARPTNDTRRKDTDRQE